MGAVARQECHFDNCCCRRAFSFSASNPVKQKRGPFLQNTQGENRTDSKLDFPIELYRPQYGDRK